MRTDAEPGFDQRDMQMAVLPPGDREALGNSSGLFDRPAPAETRQPTVKRAALNF
jgi:hypothetical protein